MLDRMHFTGAWRDYQARVLAEMEEHLDDDRLHIVAAPGAGKTVLGLELVRMLGRPALIFAPSLAIRDQWRERLVPLFMASLPSEDEISRDLSMPRVLTISTYQSLDSYRRSDELSALIETLNQHGSFTLVLDEAHHLRKAWWDCLTRLASELRDVKIVSLTATPPYDASYAEWHRYETLCGPVDLEIGIPELVRNGNLCPHQDHVILSEPSEDALALLERRRVAISELQADLRSDNALLDWLQTHPWLTDSKAHVESILDAPEMLSSVLVLLAWAGRELPAEPLKLLGVEARNLPPPSLFWLERFLDGVIFRQTDAFALEREKREALENRLQRLGLVEGKRVCLKNTRSVFRLLASSLGKIESIAQIAHKEQAALGDTLRMVVLTDHIRAGELPKRPEDEFEPAKLGVVPIFEALRRKSICADHIAVLTGSLVMVPRQAQPAIAELLPHLNLESSDVRTKDVHACPGHIELQSSSNADLTRIVTALFQSGDIRILVGTQSLLGQGWDAPALNSLVLASNTASFVLSNQMRGRAIRIDPETPDKVSNIWHLATIEPGMKGLEEAIETSLNWGEMNNAPNVSFTDIGTVARRFRAFECISNGHSDMIESGIGRLGLSPKITLDDQNDATFAIAQNRAGIADKWMTSLGHSKARSHVRQTAAPNYAPRALSIGNTLQSLVWTASGTGAFVFAEQLSGVTSLEGIGFIGMGAAGVATLASLPTLFKAGRLWWRNGSLESSLQEVTLTVLECLARTRHMNVEQFKSAKVSVRESLDGRKDIVVTGVNRATERTVMVAISELLGPVQNPRYLLVRKSRFARLRQADYHAVPSIFAARKDLAEPFCEIWNRRIGPSQLIFARTVEGREQLLKARMQSFAAGFQRSVDRRSAWL